MTPPHLSKTSFSLVISTIPSRVIDELFLSSLPPIAMERSIMALIRLRRSRCMTASLHQYLCPKLKPERDTNQLNTSPEGISEHVNVPFVRAYCSIRKLQLSCPCQARRVRSMNRAVDALVQFSGLDRGAFHSRSCASTYMI